jgi:serine protease Do
MSRSSDAYASGLRPGDVVETFNGQPVEDASQLMRLVADAPIGSTATFGVRRGTQTFELRVPVSKAATRQRSI